MYTTNNNFKVFVENTSAGNAVTGVDLTSIVAGTIIPLGDNDIALANTSGNITAPESLKLAQKTSTGITHFSDRFKIKNIIGMSYKAYTAAVEQSTVIGSAGTASTTTNIQAIDYNEYILSIIYKHDDMMWSEQINIKPYLVTTESGASSSTVSFAFQTQINNDAYSKVKAEVMTLIGTETGITGTITATNGSNVLIPSSASHGIVVGDILRVAGTGATNGVYIATAIGTGVTGITINSPFVGTTAATLSTVKVTASNYFGLKLTGLPLDWVAKGVFPYKQVAFDVTLKGFGTTTQTTTAATYPSGYYQQVSDLEWFSQFGSDGLRNATQHPIPVGRSETSSSVTYDCWTIKYKGTSEGDAIVGQSDLTSTLYVFAPTGTTTYLDYIWTPIATAAGVTIV